MITPLNTRTLRFTLMLTVFFCVHSKEARDEGVVDPVGVFNLMQFDSLPINAENVRREAQRDPVLAQVYEMSSKGWPHYHDPAL